MKIDNLEKMIKGWFVGDFVPVVYPSKDFEVAIKYYKKGDQEEKHYHRVSTEITAIASGKVMMFDQIFKTGDIITINPNEATAFEAIEDTITVVVKVPSSKNDKFISSNQETSLK